MALKKTTYVSGSTIITAENLNDIQDSVISLENTERTSISGGAVTGGANALVTKEVLDATSQLIMDEIPSELKNPYALTFTGASSGTYDGSSAVTINIPEGVSCVNVKDHGAKGDGVTDDTAAIQSALDSSNTKGIPYVCFPSGTYKVSATSTDNNFYTALNLYSGQHLIFDQTTLQLTANSYDFYAIINIHNISNVELSGNLTIIGDRESHTGTTGESGHGIRIVNSKNIYVHDINVQHTWGDGVCVGGNGTMDEISRNVTIERVQTYKCSRNGLSIIEAQDVIVRDCDFSYTDRTNPQYGIDIEPNLGTATNILIENVRMLNNGVGSFTLYVKKAKMPGTIALRNIETDSKTNIYTSSDSGATFDVSVIGWKHTQKSTVTSSNTPSLRFSGTGNLKVDQLTVVNNSSRTVIYPYNAKNIYITGIKVIDDPSVSTAGTLSIQSSADVSLDNVIIDGFLSRNYHEVTWYSGNSIVVNNTQDPT